jgi:hypothetical protein
MACSLVALVEPERVDAVQPFHPRPEPLHCRLEDEVVVGRHQAVGVNDPVEAADAVGKQPEEDEAIEVVAVDVAFVDA